MYKSKDLREKSCSKSWLLTRSRLWALYLASVTPSKLNNLSCAPPNFMSDILTEEQITKVRLSHPAPPDLPTQTF